ncbi:MAG: bifunctional adenosylcobinamide kinase/adenosylcobinamide-phosphate guanylyltransferase [Desulfovibrio sp.]|jgi:adenosylcobinamide kinase/adenosylcobinamide-phosphate guanylyltransferase|nr:bifunctional adenosylcobinamide kinase/adenosylcobinamide-phosphate guanylyltransferase [Desulfovibrio sp.]
MSRVSPPFVFISGGCRSGKSAYAQSLAERCAERGQALFLATAHPRDEETRRRIADHRRARGPCWKTREPFPGKEGDLWRDLPVLARGMGAVLLDSLTLWLSAALENLREAEAGNIAPCAGQPPAEMSWCREGQSCNAGGIGAGGPCPPSGDRLKAQALESCGHLLRALSVLPCPVVLVSDEVGLGLTPADPAGRLFRDALGLANQQAARLATQAVFVVSGLPLLLKGESLP